MFPIYLLEDNFEQRTNYAQIINNTIMINELPMQLFCQTDTAADLLAAIDQQYEGLFFLDMEIKGHTDVGLQTAIQIRDQIPAAQIVFITTHGELSFLTLERKIAPLDYVLKDRGMEHIKANIREDILKTNDLIKSGKYKKENLFTYHIGPRYFSLPLSEVVYLNTSKFNPGRVQLHALKKESEFVDNLNDLEKKYPMLFRSDKSYLINLDLLDHFDNQKREIHFINGSIAYASIRKARELVKILK
ncbi:MAG: response regulator transcription factor [Lactobacillus sp.]|uniref:response regulator transcription factor n=1 Tax=Bombilactobacillus bombi TaxID=1303590 RepID=UPI0035EED5C8|nr:response regulator transcription factor [Lactobacillus sp.]